MRIGTRSRRSWLVVWRALHVLQEETYCEGEFPFCFTIQVARLFRFVFAVGSSVLTIKYRSRSTRCRQLASGANCREKIHGHQWVWPWMHTHVHLLRVIHLRTPRLPRHPGSRIIDAYSSVTSNRYFGSKRLGRSAENLEHQVLILKITQFWAIS